MQLVILAAGHGRRFGGLKQLAPIGPNDEAIMDYTVRSAEGCGFDGIVLVIREEIRDEVLAHVERRWSDALPVEIVCQPPVPGTAQAVLAAGPVLDGPFGVANADDLYGEPAIRALHDFFAPSPRASGTVSRAAGSPGADHHVLVAYELAQTVLAPGTVTRGLCEVAPPGRLLRIVEHSVRPRANATFDAVTLGEDFPSEEDDASGRLLRLSGTERVSMNLWGFHPRILDRLAEAIEGFDPSTARRPELLLPDVVGSLVTNGRDEVDVVETTGRCVGITHPGDLDLVRAVVAQEYGSLLPARTGRGG